MGINESREPRRGRRNGGLVSSAAEAAEIEGTLDRLREEYQTLERDDPRSAGLLLEIGTLLVQLGRHRRSHSEEPEPAGDAPTAEDVAADVNALELLAARYAQWGRYASALECGFESLRVQERAYDPTAGGITWMGIGAIYGEMGELERALECYSKSMEEFRSGGSHYFEVKAIMNVANILRMKGEHQAALAPMLRCLMVFEELKERSGMIESLALIGNIHERMGNFTGALSYTQRALGMVTDEDEPILHGTILLSLGTIYRSMGRFEEALSAVESGFEIARRIDHRGLAARLHETASILHEQLGNPHEALRHHRRFVKLESDHRQSRQQAGVAELEARFELDRLRRERDIYRRQAQELQQEVYAKTRELTSLSLNLVQKSEFLEEMRRQLGQIIGAGGESPATIVKPLLADLTATIKADGTWGSFEEQCNELHHDFIRTLAERYPSLTPTELKICALTRMDLTTKEIASILFVTVRNVQNHRYRIRKKLSLYSEANLVSFLAGI